ncbi:hypothetical protein SMD11_6957 [Streptomyces albireticuli]|uniref:Uncharacterized protein n=1 Tax=Streptomyces albireticuli TaxID=1940 RepID=A0A1Z2LE02_9ACTN|nr:hypothetical protein [Streptomyces albireticuli]ARZ72533.1 hypothetical protein SMD11_6957 [Streptomyces albireticuli]
MGTHEAQPPGHADDYRQVRLAAWAGILSSPAAAIPFYLSGKFPKFFPYVDDTPGEIFAFYQNSPVVTKLQVLTGILFLFYLWFAAGLLELLRGPGRSRTLTRLTGWAMVCVVVLTFLTYTIWGAIAFWIKEDPGNTTIIAALYYVDVAIFLFLFPCIALFLVGAGLAIRRADVLPRWLGTSALVLAVPNAALFLTFMVNSGPLRPVSLLNFSPTALFCVWVVTAGICMLRSQPPTASAMQEDTARQKD